MDPGTVRENEPGNPATFKFVSKLPVNVVPSRVDAAFPLKAIFSDAHGNLEALQAVLADATGQRVAAVYNLGDTTGYGPNPVECLDLAMGMTVVLLGNNDQGILFHPDGF